MGGRVAFSTVIILFGLTGIPDRGNVLSNLKDVREGCREKGRGLLEKRKACHLKPGHASDGCGYFEGKYCYLSVDCRTVDGKPLCWISIIDHYSGQILLSRPCPDTPEAAKHGREFFTEKGPARE